MKTAVKILFDRYEQFFNKSLSGDVDMNEVTSVYASAFIAASPAGVMVGKNDDELKRAMQQGYARYRAIGTKEMRLRNVGITILDEHHCVAHVAWTATYERKQRPAVSVDFDVHYLVQRLNGDPKIFGWISGDEEALLKKHGIV